MESVYSKFIVIHVIIVGLVLPNFIYNAADPCISYKNLDQENDATRSVANSFDSTLCDSSLTSGWYRVVSKAGERMPTECILGGFRCGTSMPIWLNSKFPSVNEILNVSVCASNLYGDCCAYSHQIQIKNCSDYLVYHLKPVTPCYQAYCFGSELPCPEGQSSPNGFSPGCQVDYCESNNYDVFQGDIRRSPNNTLQTNDVVIEDSRLKSGWYRIDSVAGNDIVNEEQSMMSCGTIFPLWIKGNIPSEVNQTVNRIVCRSGTSSTCEQQINIKVRNCGSYRTYYLPQLNVDKSAYCFGTVSITEVPSVTTEPTDSLSYTPIATNLNVVSSKNFSLYVYIIVGIAILVCGLFVLAVAILLMRRRKKAPSMPSTAANEEQMPVYDTISPMYDNHAYSEMEVSHYDTIPTEESTKTHGSKDVQNYEELSQTNVKTLEESHLYDGLTNGNDGSRMTNVNHSSDNEHLTNENVNSNKDSILYASDVSVVLP